MRNSRVLWCRDSGSSQQLSKPLTNHQHMNKKTWKTINYCQKAPTAFFYWYLQWIWHFRKLGHAPRATTLSNPHSSSRVSLARTAAQHSGISWAQPAPPLPTCTNTHIHTHIHPRAHGKKLYIYKCEETLFVEKHLRVECRHITGHRSVNMWIRRQLWISMPVHLEKSDMTLQK